MQQKVAQQIRQQQLLQAAAQFNQQQNQGQPGRPAEQLPNLDQPQIQGGELLDESLPTAGGGAVQ